MMLRCRKMSSKLEHCTRCDPIDFLASLKNGHVSNQINQDMGAAVAPPGTNGPDGKQELPCL